MKVSKEQILELLWSRPVEIGHWVGFKDLTDMHNEWLRSFLYSKEDQTLQGHRGSYKTTTLSLFFAIHAIEKPNETVMFFRKTGTDVNEIVRQTSNIMKSGCIRYIVNVLYGKELILIKDTNSEIHTNLATAIKGQSQFAGLGIGTSITGKHADIVVTDDIVNVKDRTSQAERENTKTAYMELQNIKNRGGRFINTGTPWHKEDCFTLMPNPKKYDCYHSGLMTEQQIADLRLHMTPSLFAANYELKHIADENQLFPEPKQGADTSKVFDGLCQLDSAFYGEDFTAFTVMTYEHGVYYVFGKIWRKHVEDCYGEILHLYLQLKCGKMYIEKNADKGMVSRDLRNIGIRTVNYTESMNKHIKISTYLKAIWADVVFVDGTDAEYIEQICDYTEEAEHDDACLAGDTLVATLTGDKPIKDIKSGEYVITPAGIRKVLFAGITGYKQVKNYYGVKSTCDHKFFDYETGFTTADSLTNAPKFDIIGLRRLLSWKRKLLYLMGRHIREAKRADITLSSRLEMQKGEMQSSCTEPCGNITMEKYRKAIMYTTLMAMLTITTLATWSVYQLGNICRCMARRTCKMKNTELKTKNSSKASMNLQKNGINQKPEKNGIASTLRNLFSKQIFAKKSNANTAVRNTWEQHSSGFVQADVLRKQEEERKVLNSCDMKEYAFNADAYSRQRIKATNSALLSASKDSIKIPVYNLMVDGAGCFYANGILVSNCDSASSLARILYPKIAKREGKRNIVDATIYEE